MPCLTPLADRRRGTRRQSASGAVRCSAPSSMPPTWEASGDRTRRAIATGRCSRIGRNPTPYTWRCSIPADNTTAVVTLPCPTHRYPSIGRHHPPAIRLERAIRDLYGLEPEHAPGSTSVARSRPMDRSVIRWRGAEPTPASLPPYPFLDRRRRRVAPDRGWPGSRRHHRTRPFPLLRQRRNSGASRGAARLRP